MILRLEILIRKLIEVGNLPNRRLVLKFSDGDWMGGDSRLTAIHAWERFFG